MSRRVILEIQESVKELNQAYIQEKCAYRTERLHMLYLYQSEQAQERNQLSKLLDHRKATLIVWIKLYQADGMSALLEKRATGHSPLSILQAALKEIEQKLNSETGFRDYRAVQQWGLEVPYTTVFNNVKYRLKANLKTVRPCSVKQDIASKEQFKKNCNIY